MCEVQSDKATVEITSRYDGKIVKVNYQEGDIVKVGTALVDIETDEASNQTKLVNEPIPTKSAVTSNESDSFSHADTPYSGLTLTTPAVRKIAKENKIELSSVIGTGPKGRILKEDILSIIGNNRYVPSLHSPVKPVITSIYQPATTSTTTPAPTPAPTPIITQNPIQTQITQNKVIPIRGIQRLMVKTMNSANQIQHLTLCEELYFSEIVKLRQKLKKIAEKRDIKLSYLPILLKLLSQALIQFPMLNSTVNSEVTEVTYHSNHNFGVAIDTSKGLIVPVIKNIQNKSIFDIAIELNQLQVCTLILFIYFI